MNHKSWIVNSNPEISIKHKLLSLNLPLLFYQPLSFGEKCTLPPFLENKQSSNPYSLWNVGEMQLWLIKTNCLTYFLLQIKLVIIEIFTFKSENVAFTKLLKNIKDKTIKYTKWLNFLLFSLFRFILRNYILGQHNWKVLHDLIFTRAQHMYMFDYLTKTSIISLTEFTVDSINCFCWESNPYIKRQKYCLHSFNEYKLVRKT